MRVVLNPVLPRILAAIKEYGAEGITRIDLDENEYEALYHEYGQQVSSSSDQRPFRGSYLLIEKVCVQCCY